MARRPGPVHLAKSIGGRIRALRMATGVTQEQLAWNADLDKGFLSQIEAGKRLPSIAVLATIAARLKVDILDLFVLDLRSPRMRVVEATRTGEQRALAAALRDFRRT